LTLSASTIAELKHEYAEDAARSTIETKRVQALATLGDLSTVQNNRAGRLVAATRAAFVTVPSEDAEKGSHIRPMDRPLPEGTPFLAASLVERVESDGERMLRTRVPTDAVGHAVGHHATSWIGSSGTLLQVRSASSDVGIRAELETSAAVLGARHG
jgi:hypothetical protein